MSLDTNEQEETHPKGGVKILIDGQKLTAPTQVMTGAGLRLLPTPIWYWAHGTCEASAW